MMQVQAQPACYDCNANVCAFELSVLNQALTNNRELSESLTSQA
jgi:hypothetical protein